MALFDLKLNQEPTDKIASLKYRLFLADLNDTIDEWPKAFGATIGINILKPGATYKYIDCKVNTINPSTVPGESPLVGVLSIAPILEGISKQALDWLYQNKGKRFVAIWERCETGQKFLGGSPCSGGMLLSFVNIGKQDGGMDGIALDLTGGECSEPFYFYDGPIIREEPVIINLGDKATFALTEKSQYILADNAAAGKRLDNITNITDKDLGRIIEIHGGGVNFPTTVGAPARFHLNNGLPFLASAGRSISLMIFKWGSDIHFREVYRS